MPLPCMTLDDATRAALAEFDAKLRAVEEARRRADSERAMRRAARRTAANKRKARRRALRAAVRWWR